MPGFVAVVAGPEHVFEYVNEPMSRSPARSNFVGRSVREAFPELAGQGYYELLDEVYATGETVVARGMELRLQGSDEVQFIDFVYQPIRNDEGHVTGIFVGGYEVTEAHRAAAALRASEARLRELNADLERKVIERTQARGRTWQVSPDLLGALNPKGYFETSNPAWKTVLGWSEEEVASMSIFEMLHPDDVERTRAGFELTQQGQPAIRFPNRYRCKDGTYRWISWVGVPEEGMVYCSGRDITEEKAAEADLAKTQEALRQAQKMEAIGQLTGGIAHDFNNLLAGISGSLELLERRLAEGRLGGVERYIVSAQSSTRRAAALTQRLLAFSRRQTLDPKPTNVNRLISGMEDLIRRTVGPGYRRGSRRRGWALDDKGRSIATGKRAAQSLHQCPRRDAERRPHHDRNRQQVAGRAGSKGAGAFTGSVCLSLRHRHRHGHDARCDFACLRSLFHHQADWPRDWAWAFHDPRLRSSIRRASAHLFRTR